MARLVLAGAGLCLMFGMSLGLGQGELRRERILLTFIPNVQFAPFYVGIADGHFAEQGFDVSLEHLQEPEALDLVAAGQANFGVVSGEQVILARGRGRDVVYVYEWFQQYPVGIVMAGTGEDFELEGLRGKTVGLPGRYGASYSGMRALLGSAGMGEGDVVVEEIGFNAPEVFCLGVVDAVVVYVNNEPLQIRNRAEAGECGDVEEIAVVPVAGAVDLVSNGLIARADALVEDGEMVGRMVAGFNGALRSTIENPARAYLLSGDFVETLPGDEALLADMAMLAAEQAKYLEEERTRAEVAGSRGGMLARLRESHSAESLTQFEVLLRTIALWDAEVLGYSDMSSWEAMAGTLGLMGLVDDGEVDLGAAFSNRFIMGGGE